MADGRADDLLLEFAFDDGDSWIAQMREALAPSPLGAMGRFALEAEIARELSVIGSLDHPHVCALFGAEWIDGHAVLVMPLIEGRDIVTWARDGASIDDTVRCLVEVCAGVQHAHAHGIIHRDLKPTNVLVSDDGRPRVLDFGLALLVADANDAAPLTRTGAFVGTPRYAAPEQREGSRGDARADIYALGVLAAEALASHELDAALAAVLEQAQAPEPRDRYQSVELLRMDLDAWRGGRPVMARPETWRDRTRRAVRSHPRTALAGAVMALLVLTLAGAALEAQRAELREARHAESARALPDELLEPVGAHAVTFGAAPTEHLDEAVRRLDRLEHVDLETRAAVRLAISRRYARAGQWDAAGALARNALADLDAAHIDRGLLRARAVRGIGTVAAIHGEKKAVALQEEALALMVDTATAPAAERAGGRIELAYARTGRADGVARGGDPRRCRSDHARAGLVARRAQAGRWRDRARDDPLRGS